MDVDGALRPREYWAEHARVDVVVSNVNKPYATIYDMNKTYN